MLPLSACKLFKELTATELDFLKDSVQERRFGAGQDIFREGEPGHGVFAVKMGKVKISRVTGGGDYTFAHFLQGDIFGEMAVFEDKPRSATATAELDTMVYFIPREAMLDLMVCSPTFPLTLVRVISGRLREFNRQFVHQAIQGERMNVVGRLATSIVNDLRNPLSIIGQSTDVACQDSSTPFARQEARNRVRKQMDHITDMLNDIIEYSSGEAARPAMELIDYDAFVAEEIGELLSEVQHKGVKIVLDEPPPSIFLRINAERLGRVFWNLVMNAVDAMGNGGRVMLRFSQTATHVVTEIEDSGKGLPPEMLNTLFQAFAGIGKTKGTGLGLSITRKIIQEHGGDITARNQPGGGAVFSFTLPIPKDS